MVRVLSTNKNDVRVKRDFAPDYDADRSTLTCSRALKHSQSATFVAASEGMLCIPLNTLAAWPPGNLPASGPLPRSYFLMFGGTHEQKFASTLAYFVHLSLSSLYYRWN